MACKPGSVPLPLTGKRDGHSSGPPVAGRFSRPTRASGPAKPAGLAAGATPLFGLAPGGACHAVPVTRSAVGSYPTLSPLPLIFSLGGRSHRAVCFLWRYPWGRPRRALPAAFSPWSPDFPPPRREARERPPGHLIRGQGWARGGRASRRGRPSPLSPCSTVPFQGFIPQNHGCHPAPDAAGRFWQIIGRFRASSGRNQACRRQVIILFLAGRGQVRGAWSDPLK
ncbi:MAG: hypothetical protein JWO83_2772 [Caulobacteraceae bacterium]|nr:hypothetical protein [Caulobacteraceae bacterium]